MRHTFYLIATFVGLFATSAASAYEPPAGVPEPAFGIDQTTPPNPASWAENIPGYYFVEAGGSNSGNGFPANPRSSIPRNLSAGDKVVISGSNGPISIGAITIRADATFAQPAFITGVNSASLRSANGAAARERLNFAGQYLIVEDLIFSELPIGTGGAANLSIRDCEFTAYSPGRNSSAIAAGGTDNVFYRNHIHDNGDPEGSEEADVHGIKVVDEALRIWILDSHMHNNGGDSVQVGSAQTNSTWPQFIYIAGNRLHRDRENAYDIKKARDVIMSQNEIYDYIARNSSSGEGIIVHDGAERVWVIFNEIYNVNIGVISTGSSGFYVIGNIIRDITNDTDTGSLFGSMAMQARATSDPYVVGNTFANINKGVALASGGNSIVITDNIFAGLNTSSFHIAILTTSAMRDSTVRGNLYADVPNIRISGRTYSALSDFADAYAGAAEGSLQGNPDFVAPAIANYELGPASAGIDAGSRNTVYSIFSALYGLGIEVDAKSDPRPQGGNFDMGALEAPGAAEIRPAPVQGITVRQD